MSAWTKENPTEPGWYWYRWGADGEPSCVRIAKSRREHLWCVTMLEWVDVMTGEWQPIEPPKP